MKEEWVLSIEKQNPKCVSVFLQKMWNLGVDGVKRSKNTTKILMESY
jgi:hypothetical protein